MKKINLLLLMLFLLASCSKDNDDELPGMSAMIANQEWQAFTIDTHIYFAVPSGYPALAITAITLEDQKFEIDFNDTISATYIVNQDCSVYYHDYSVGFVPKTYRAIDGEVNLNVNSAEHIISGSFSCILTSWYDNPTDTLVITDGSFSNLRYTNYH